MNKKILFLVLLILVVFPLLSYSATSPDTWITKIKDGFVKIGAAIVIIGWIIAGILWLISMGNPAKLATARMAIVACVVGTLLIIISATAETFITTTFGL